MRLSLKNRPRPNARCVWRLATNASFQAVVLLRLAVVSPRVLLPVARRLLLLLHSIDVVGSSSRPTLGPYLKLPHPLGIVLGEGAHIGSHVTIYQNVTIGQKAGEYPIIGAGVTIWPGSVVVGGITVGDNAQIGALSFLDRDLASGAVWHS